jgi:hypothetical protein
MKKPRPQKPYPTLPKKIRNQTPDWERYEYEEMVQDRKERERKLAGPSEEAKKLLNKK